MKTIELSSDRIHFNGRRVYNVSTKELEVAVPFGIDFIYLKFSDSGKKADDGVEIWEVSND